MILSTKGRYAVTAMMDLAINGSNGPVSLVKISSDQGISVSYLEQLFAKLRRSKLVEGVRGPGGGYRLSKPSNNITIAEIILAVDETSKDTQWLGAESCQGAEARMTHRLWEELSHRLYEFLNGITLADFVKHPEVKHIVVPLSSNSNRISKMFLPVARAS